MAEVEVNQETPARTVIRRGRGWTRFLVIALALHIPLFIYPVLRLGSWLESPWWLTLLILIPVTASQTISRVYLRGPHTWLIRKLRQTADLVLGVSPIVLIALLVGELLVAFHFIAPLIAAKLVLLVGAISAAVGIWSAITPLVKSIVLSSSKVDDRLRFVQITDVHIGSRSKDFLDVVVHRINQINPDFLCITGDFIDATGVSQSDLESLATLRCPIYFSIGNHERYEDLDDIVMRLENLGVQVLRNRQVMHSDAVQVIGIDDMDDALQVQRELGPIDLHDDAYKILLYHRPRGLESAAARGIDLMLSGHTHNGQIIPFNLVVNRVFEMSQGLFTHGHTHLYVSQGTGTWGPVMRFGTRSEITLFEVNPEEAGTRS